MYTNQQVFDIVVKGLASQGWQRSAEGQDCMYRYNELRCAAGWLIPDELYSYNMERKTISQLIDHRVITKSQLGVDDIKLIQACQDAHDSGPVILMKDRFREVAAKFNLDLPEELVNG